MQDKASAFNPILKHQKWEKRTSTCEIFVNDESEVNVAGDTNRMHDFSKYVWN